MFILKEHSNSIIFLIQGRYPGTLGPLPYFQTKLKPTDPTNFILEANPPSSPLENLNPPFLDSLHLSTGNLFFPVHGKWKRLIQGCLFILSFQLYNKYPSRPVFVKAYTTKPPVFASSRNGTNVTVNGNAEIHVIAKNGAPIYALTIGLVSSLAINPLNGQMFLY